MFITENVQALFKKGTLKLIATQDGYRREAEATLVIEPFPPRLARELGEDIAGHLFTDDDDDIREELEAIDLRVTVGTQNVFARRHGELQPCAILSPCTIKDVVVKRCSKKDEVDWLSCSFVVVFGLEDKEARAFVLDEFGKLLHWTFESMQRDLLGKATLHDAAAALGESGVTSLTGPDGETVRFDSETTKKHRAAAKTLRAEARRTH